MPSGLAAVAQALSSWTVAALVLGVTGYGLWRRIPVYEAFIRGARSGMAVGLRLVPYLVAMLSAVELFRSSGAMDGFLRAAGPLVEWLGIPAPVLPMALLRPLSGSAAMAFLASTFKRYGPDSLLGFTASVMQGSTETTLYVATVYLGAVGIRDPRWAVTTGLLADAGGFLASCAVSRIFWRGP